MAKNTSTQPPVWPAVRRIIKMTGGLQAWLGIAILFDLLQAATILLGNHFNRKFFDAVSNGQPDVFWYFVALSLGLGLAGIPISYLRVWSLGRFSEGGLARIRRMIATHSTRLPVGYLESRHSGDMLSVLNADLGKLQATLNSSLIQLFGQSVRGLAALIYIISINWILALVSVVVTPLLFVLVSMLTAPMAKRSQEMQEEIGQVNSVAQDSISGAMVVKAFNLTGIMEQRFHETNQQALGKGYKIARLRAWIDSIGLGLSITPFIIAIGLGGYLLIEGKMTFGSFFAFINLLNYVVNPIGNIPNLLAGISEAAGAGQRVFEVLDQPAERADGRPESPAARPETAIQLSKVSFAYDPAAPVLKDVSLDIAEGQTVAIVGPSGGGKSTLLKLLLGYYPLAAGQVKLFGRDLADWKLDAARQQMAFVAQNTYLFPVSVGENIRLGKPGASQAEIEQAARAANIHDFISGLPDGYDTPAGEWGSRLSGGQKQRLALARAILKDAPVLLLDEPTSALDTESETLVQQALENFSRNRTTVVIAHRLSTIKNADRVLVLQDGEIVEQGTHDELLAQGGVYLDLYQHQFVQPAGNGGGVA